MKKSNVLSISWAAVSSAAIVLIVFALTLAACSSGRLGKPIDNSQSLASGSQTDNEGGLRQAAKALAELEGLPTPSGCDAGTFDALKREFARLIIKSAAIRTFSAAPTGADNQVNDLWLVDQGGGNWALTWSYRNIGDYDQTGEVGVPDIT